VIIRGHFIGDAPYFSAYLKTIHFKGFIWFLADTGASRTTLVDRDVRLLKIPQKILEPSPVPIVGIGGSVRSFVIHGVEITFASDEGEMALQRDLMIIQQVSVGIYQFQTTQEEITTHLLAAGSIISIVPVVLIFIFLQRYIVGLLIQGSVKG